MTTSPITQNYIFHGYQIFWAAFHSWQVYRPDGSFFWGPHRCGWLTAERAEAAVLAELQEVVS